MEWADETIIRLRELWDEGHSTAEIGRRLGVSKNAVVGKAHRLDLPARPSPIRREGERPPPRLGPPRHLAGSTLPPLSSTGLGSSGLASASLGPIASPASLPPRPQVVVAPRPAAPPPRTVLAQQPPPRPYGRVITCCWPIGEPGTRSFRFCDAESVPGKPYCAEHAQLAYVKVRDRREDAA
jgi:GcrA cell cycle regulator